MIGLLYRWHRREYDPNRSDELHVDALLINTHPGLDEETVLSMVISNALIIILRPDQQDYEGTGVTVLIARRLHQALTILQKFAELPYFQHAHVAVADNI